MENRLIFLSMAAIDEKRAEENQWLPDDLFPLVTHRITAAGSSNYGNKFSLFHSKIYTIKGTSNIWFCAVILL